MLELWEENIMKNNLLTTLTTTLQPTYYENKILYL